MSKSPAYNISFLVIGRILDNLITIIFYSFTARFLGSDNFGIYVYALTVGMLITTFTDMGLTRYVLKEISKKAKGPHFFFGQCVIFLILFNSLALFGVSIIYFFIHKDILAWHITMIVSLGYTLFSIGNFYLNYFRALEEMDIPIYLILTFKTLLLFSIIPNLWMKIEICWLSYAYLFSSIIFVILCVWYTHFKKGTIAYRIKYYEIIKIIKQAFPFAAISILGMINFQPIPVFLLNYFHAKNHVGYFGASFRLIDALCFFSYTISLGLFPVFVRLYKNNSKEIRICFSAVQKILFCIIIPTCAAVILLKEKCILFFYGNGYLPSISILQILIWVGFFLYFNCLYASMLQAVQKNNIVIRITVITILIQFIIGIFIISPLKGDGSAFTSLAGHFVGYLLYFTQIRSYIDWNYMSMIWKIIFGTFIMNATLVCLPSMQFIPLVFIGLIVYGISLYLFNPFHSDEIKWLKTKSILT